MTFDNLLDELTRIVQQKQPVVYITGHPLYLERRRKELRKRTGGYLNVRWYTWSQWVDRLLHAGGCSYVRITHSIRQDILTSLLHQLDQKGQIPNLADGLQHPGMSKSIALWIEDLTKDRVDKWYPNLSSSQDTVLRELGQVAFAYFNWTGDPANVYKESCQLDALACNLLLEKETHVSAELTAHFFLEGECPQTTSRKQLLTVLQELRPDLFTNFHSYPDDVQLPLRPIHWFGLPSVGAEARAAAQDVRRALQHGTPLSEVAVVVPNEEYRRRVARELYVQGIPLQNEKQEDLLHLGAVQHLLALYQLKSTNWSREALLTAVDRQGTRSGIPAHAVAWGRDLIRQSGVQEGEKEWRNLFRSNWGRGRKRLSCLLEQGVQEVEEEAKSIRQRLESAKHWLWLLRRFSRLLDDVPDRGTWTEFLRITQSWNQPATPEDIPVCEALRHLLRVRDEIEQSFFPDGGTEITVQRFSQWLLEKARSTPCLSSIEEFGVHICLPDEICGGRFSYLYVLGLAEDLFPSAYAPHWIWERGGNAQREMHEQMERRRLQAVLHSVTHALFLYTPQTAGRGQPVSPNRDLSRLLGEPQLRTVGPQRVQGVEIHEIVFSSKEVPLFANGHMLHVTGLDLYRRCAFRYFADRLLQVRGRTERSEGITPLDIGSVMHNVLKKWVEAEGTSVEEGRAEVERLVIEEMDRLEQRWNLSGTIWSSQKERVSQDLLQFVQHEMEQIARPEQMSIGEWGFGLVYEEKMGASSTLQPLLLQKDDQTVLLCGVVDRIDVNPYGFAVHDYKLSSCPSTQEMEEGEDLQVALYLLAYHRLTGMVPHRGRYALLRELGGGAEVSFDQGDGAFAQFIERVEQRVFALVDRMKRGDVAPRPWKRSECLRCTYQTVCREAIGRERRQDQG